MLAKNRDSRARSLQEELEDMRRALQEKEEHMRDLREEMGMANDGEEEEEEGMKYELDGAPLRYLGQERT
jgi:hypothetical protein